jgi:hypothetical protein
LSGDLWLVVGDASLPAFSGEEIERRLTDLAWVSACAVAHERVVAFFADRMPVVPMKLFTLFASDERAVAVLSEQRERLTAVLGKVAGRAEWGVRITFDAGRAKRVTTSAAESAEPVSGRGFLLRKKEALEAARNLAGQAATAAEAAFAELLSHADAARRREPLAGTTAESGPRLLLDAAFLVPLAPDALAAGFERAVQAAAERLAASACEVTLTGPWPPYNFIEGVE